MIFPMGKKTGSYYFHCWDTNYKADSSGKTTLWSPDERVNKKQFKLFLKMFLWDEFKMPDFELLI